MCVDDIQLFNRPIRIANIYGGERVQLINTAQYCWAAQSSLLNSVLHFLSAAGASIPLGYYI